MQQTQKRTNCNDPKNVIVIGKTGLGKSYFLNLLLNNQKPQNGVFKVFDNVDSGTHTCQVEVNKIVHYGQQNNFVLLNLIDTPGLFDTKDDPKVQYHDQFEPQSIQHLRNIQQAVISPPFQSQFNRVILVIASDSKFDVQHQGMIDISKIMIGQQLKVCVAVTKCQNLYDNEIQGEQEILQQLLHFQNQWKQKLASFEIEDVYFFGNQPISRFQGRVDLISKFYSEQWIKLYETLQKSIKSQINTWDRLPIDKKQIIGKYFNYRIGKTEQQKDAEFKAEKERLQQELGMQKVQAQIEYKKKEQQYLLKQQQFEKMQLQKLEKDRQHFQKQQDDLRRESEDKFSDLISENNRLYESMISQFEEQMVRQQDDFLRAKAQSAQRLQRLEKQISDIKKEESQNKANLDDMKTKYHYRQTQNDGNCVSLDVQITSNDKQFIQQNNSVQDYEYLMNHNKTKIKINGYEQDNFYLGLIHFSKRQECYFRRFTFISQDNEEFVELTEEHLIFVSNQRRFVQAKQVTYQDTLLYNDKNNQVKNVQIKEIKLVKKRGFYSPLTTTGQFFGNGILISCYVSPSEFPISQEIAHFSMKPLIYFRQIAIKIDLKKAIRKENDEIENYQAPYSRFLQQIFCQ